LWSWFTLTLDLRERIEALAIEDASWIKMYCVLFRKIEKHFPPPIGQAAFDLGSCEKLYERALRNMPKQGQPHPSSLPVNAGVLHTASTPTGALCALRGGGSVTGGLNFSCRSATAGAKGSACHRALRTLGSDERTVDGAPSFCPAIGSGHRPLTHGPWSAAGISAAPSGAHGLLPMGDLELSSTAPPFAASAEDAALHARGMANDLWEDVKRQCLANVLHSQQADDQGGAATATAVAMASSGTAAGATIFREAEIDAVATSAGQQVMSHVQLCSVSAPLDTLTLSGNAVVEPLRLLRLLRLAATKDDFLSRPLPASFVKQIALAPSRGCSGAAGSTTDSSNSFIGRGSGGGQQHGETAGGGQWARRRQTYLDQDAVAKQRGHTIPPPCAICLILGLSLASGPRTGEPCVGRLALATQSLSLACVKRMFSSSSGLRLMRWPSSSFLIVTAQRSRGESASGEGRHLSCCERSVHECVSAVTHREVGGRATSDSHLSTAPCTGAQPAGMRPTTQPLFPSAIATALAMRLRIRSDRARPAAVLQWEAVAKKAICLAILLFRRLSHKIKSPIASCVMKAMPPETATTAMRTKVQLAVATPSREIITTMVVPKLMARQALRVKVHLLGAKLPRPT
jgi:hypothetical protein